MEALRGSVRRRPRPAEAQTLIAQFAQMAPRPPAAARKAESVPVDLTSDASDDEPSAVPPVMHATAAAQLRGSDGADPPHQAVAVHDLASPRRPHGGEQRSSLGTDGTAAGQRAGSMGDAGGAQASESRKRSGGACQATDADGLGKQRRVGEGAGAAGVQQASSDGVGVVVVDDEGTAEVAGESAVDTERRRRRALCAAAAERRHAAVVGEVEEPQEAHGTT